MISITEKTLQDLQFPTVLETISSICNTDKTKALEITPFKDKETLMQALLQTLNMSLPFKITMRFQIMVLMP
jgi:DNA mismatch repair protein MutS2